MSIKQYPGGIITKNPMAPAGPYQCGAAPGIWTIDQVAEYVKQGIWPIAGNALPRCSQTFTGSGTYSWVAPSGVTSVSVVAVGGQTSGNNCPGGGLGWKNNITVVPGTSYTVGVGQSYFIAQCVVSGLVGSSGIGGTFTGDGGGNGGNRSCPGAGSNGGGGGAGGYTGNGGNGGAQPSNAGLTAGAGGGGGGGIATANPMAYQGQGGGGVGVFGQGASGAAGGCNGGSGGTKGNGGNVGGSSGGGTYGGGTGGGGGSQVGGAVRIVWPGNTRLFPSTDVGVP
jgi:hypothetical protein